MHSAFATQQETSRTAKAPRYRTDRFPQWRLWMQDLLQPQQQNKGFLTSAENFTGTYTGQKYFFDKTIYENRIFDSKGVADPDVEIQFGPNIKDWPEMPELAENLVLKVVSEIHDPVTTTDELIPSGETSSYRSNPLGLAEFTLSRKDPEYVAAPKKFRKLRKQSRKANALWRLYRNCSR